MIYRWIYNIWRFFWISIAITAGIVFSLLLVVIGVIQLPQSKSYLKGEIENTFNEQFEGTLYIDSVEGFLPFQIKFNGGQFYASGEIAHPAISFENAMVSVNWWSLLQQNLSIESFELHEPAIHITKSGDTINIARIFVQRPSDEITGTDDTPFYEELRLFEQIDLFAPRLSIINGSLLTASDISIPDELHLPTPLNIQHLNTDLFLEITDSQLFADISNFSAVIPDSPYQYIRIEGQFYNDDRFFEVNGLNIATAESDLELSFDAVPVSIFRQGTTLGEQFTDAEFQITVNPSSVTNRFATLFIPDFPDIDEEIGFELRGEGTTDEFWIDRFQAIFGESSVIATANLKELLSDEFIYDVQIENIVLQPDQLQWVSDSYLNRINTESYQSAIIKGDLSGSLYESSADLLLESEAGNILVDFYVNHREIPDYELLAELDSLDISPIIRDTLTTSVLNGRIALTGRGYGDNMEFLASADLAGSSLTDFEFRQIMAEFDYSDSRLSYSFEAQDETAALQASGTYTPSETNPQFTAEGQVQNLNLSNYTGYFEGDNTDFNATFSANIGGKTIDTVHGRVSVETDRSIIGPDTLRAHQLYADLSPPGQTNRILRFTSSFFDGELEGSINPSTLMKFAAYWNNYLQERIQREILFNSEFRLAEIPVSPEDFELSDIDLSLQLSIKDLQLLRHYLPDLPEIQSSARLTVSLNASKEELSISGNLFDDAFLSENISASNVNTSISSEFNYGESIREFGNVDFQVNSELFSWNEMQFKDSYLNFSMRNDSLQLQQQFIRQDDLKLESSLSGSLSPGKFEVAVNNFNIGAPRYNWQTEGNPKLIYTDDQKLTLQNVRLTSDEDLLAIDGTFSESFEDSVDFKVENFNLSRISDLIGGRIQFSGILNGDFITRSLTQIPSIQGKLNVDEARINNRLIGDVDLTSQFNSEENRFDTDIRIFTDPNKYPGYISQNESTGQDLRLDGYFKIPDDLTSTDEELYFFDADLREIDLWIVTLIVPKVIQQMEGRAGGTGFISGTRNDFDFNADFEVEHATGVPVFTNVEYQLSGPLTFNKSDGLRFNNIQLTDHRGGSGELSGTVDLNNFQPGTNLDLTFDLNNIQFMDNPYDPDVPFYANLYGTGQARITGTNTSPFLRTTVPVSLSSDSRIAIPLEEETEFEQDRRFIQFVDTFDLTKLEDRLRRQTEESTGNGNDDEEELTFNELFTMDLQFAANNPVNVQLIFDPVTNEILNANGTGQVRILLEDQDVSMFGRFNIESGDYQFVSGDIFTRRFNLEEGGAISWQGDLIDASLDVQAVYRARPVISTLLSSNVATASPETGQRIPIELVLQIGGTITEVENDFFFRVPTGIEGTLDPTLATQINNLNQNEDEKLIQATSILLSGNFIPSSQAQGLGIGEGLSGTAAVVNPLISSQVINPLLSNQINSLLRSDITFDIDLNLTAFNEVDLGVALRLFDDRVILRREGQITGEQSDIGDLGATYRINRTFSLTAFHRQDPTLSYTSGVEARQTQEMNGIGLETQVQFNTWQQFKQRISNAFRRLFGLNSRDDESEESTDQEIVSPTDKN